MVIESGVEPGELLVTDRVDKKLQDGAQVVIGREEETGSTTQAGANGTASGNGAGRNTTGINAGGGGRERTARRGRGRHNESVAAIYFCGRWQRRC